MSHASIVEVGEFVKTHVGLGCRCSACFVMFIFPKRIRCAGAFNRSRRARACRTLHVLIAIAEIAQL